MAKKSTKALAAEILNSADVSNLQPMRISPSAEALRRSVEERWVLHDPARLLLRTVCEAITRAEAASELIAREGLTFQAGESVRAHPAIVIERDARNAASLTMQKLLLSLDPAEG